MGYTPLEIIKTLSFATTTNVIGPAVNYILISKAINLTPKAQIRTAIQDGKYAANMLQICCKYAANMLQICCKYAANMRTRQSISQSASGTTISDDVNWVL